MGEGTNLNRLPRAEAPNMAQHDNRDQSSCTVTTWTVYRQDDNGNRFVVAQHLAREEALRIVDEFEARAHKQVYWAEPDPGQ
jgi:hypothetical protein